MTVTQPSGEYDVSRRMAVAREWDELAGQVRKIDGFGDFLRSPSISSLRPAAAAGPIAVINVSRWRCDAMIMTTSGVEVTKLPDLTLDAAVEQLAAYLEVLRAAEVANSNYVNSRRAARSNRDHDAVAHSQKAAVALSVANRQADKVLNETQAWLWDAVAEPVLRDLGFTDRLVSEEEAARRRVWWCPTGPLTLLPLHAAGHHRDLVPAGQAPRTVIDRVVSSYTPTVRALLEARRPRAEPERPAHDPNRMLIVSLENTPNQVPLAGVNLEVENLKSLFPGAHTLLEGTDATRKVVSGQLPLHRWVHFGCHGDQNFNAPSEGGVILCDGPLTVADVNAGQFRGDFVGLAACKTAVGGIALLDESITLAAALHYTGYRHVVAALWSVHDETTAILFNALYQKLTKDGQLHSAGSALALHQVMMELRDGAVEMPRLWAPFTHTGP